jgi:acyl-CoA thioester hydrolase
MIQHITNIRVKYADTDRMDYVYYGKYAEYLEVGRTELIRSLGFPYKEMEAQGIMLPVSSLQVKYIRPAKYDDWLTIITTITELPVVKLKTQYEIYNQNNVLLIQAEVILPFVNMETGKITKIPESMQRFFVDNWKNS